MQFVICTNNEILSDGTCFFESDCGLDVNAIIAAAVREVMKHDDLDFDTDSDFQSWRGGLYSQVWNTCGHVAVPTDASEEWVAIAWRIHDAITAEIAAQERLEQESA
jgi:hypothetical protein